MMGMGRKLSLVLAVAVAGGLAACSPPSESPPARALPYEHEARAYEGEARSEKPVVRPRLSQTVTLGQGQQEAYQPSPDPAVVAPPSSNVIINNNVTVLGAPPVYGYGGYGYGYGYGGWGYGWGSGARDARVGSSPRNGGSQPWGSTGWEGAQRTAPPGQTPGVGGNWSPPPSYGPSQMK